MPLGSVPKNGGRGRAVLAAILCAQSSLVVSLKLDVELTQSGESDKPCPSRKMTY